jgi:hypothetical protein
MVQYNTLGREYPLILFLSLKISRDRVPMKIENAILAPNHPVLNTLIKSMTKDFLKGWKQEQGLYPNEFDKAFTLFFIFKTIKGKILAKWRLISSLW